MISRRRKRPRLTQNTFGRYSLTINSVHGLLETASHLTHGVGYGMQCYAMVLVSPRKSYRHPLPPPCRPELVPSAEPAPPRAAASLARPPVDAAVRHIAQLQRLAQQHQRNQQHHAQQHLRNQQHIAQQHQRNNG